MKNTLRINFTLPAYYSSPIGGYLVVYEYANFLAAHGHHVTIIYPRRHHESDPARSFFQPLKDRLRIRETLYRNKPLVSWFNLHPDVKLVLTPDLRASNIPDADVTVATAWQTAGAINILPASKGRKFYLIQHYETWSGPKHKVDATWLMSINKVVISKWLYELGKELGAHNLRYIPNGIDLMRYRVITPPERRPMSVVSLYHHEKFKGVPDALATLEIFHGQFPSIPISMFGTPPRGKDIPDWINYFENPAQDVLVRDIYNGHAVYLGASLAEGWALPPAEAMACGCAFVGTDIGGFREYAKNGETALLSPAGDREALLQNLCAIVQSPELLRSIQSRGSSHIQHFTWENSGTALEQYFKEAEPAQSEHGA